jgi:hypothetical protein
MVVGRQGAVRLMRLTGLGLLDFRSQCNFAAY